MRTITTHYDSHGLNDIIGIEADDRDTENGGGASHYYRLAMFPPDSDNFKLCQIQFQHGPRNVEGSTPGITEAVLLAILIDRLEGFQAGPYACSENETQLGHLRAAMDATRARADERARQGVLGKNEPHTETQPDEEE